MSWLFRVLGLSGNQAEVDSTNSLKTTGPTTLTQVGFSALAARNDDGTAIGTPTTRRIWSTETGHLIVALQDLYWDDTFNAAAQNTAKYRYPVTTQAVAHSGGFAVLNNAGITTANTNSAIQTYRTFPLLGNHETRVIFSGGFNGSFAPVANNVVEMGLMTATLPGGAAPTDGVFFRWNTAVELRGVISYNGTETQTAAITKPADNVNHDFMIIAQNDTVSFWIDRVRVGSITLTTDAPTLGQPFSQATLPATVRTYIGATPPASGVKVFISDIFVKVVGPDAGRSWEVTKAGFGHMGYQGQNGGTMGSSANYANSANPAPAVPTNTTAALGTGLGGQFWETDTLAVTTDGIISSFQNPAGGITQTPRNLIVYGVQIQSHIQTILTGGGYVASWSLAFGHTAVSLATAEAATTKAPRRIPLGFQSVTAAAAALTVLSTVSVQFKSPIVLAPGEFIATVKKKIGTAPSAGTVAHLVTFDSVFE